MEAILLMENFNLIYNAKTLAIHSIELQEINLHDTSDISTNAINDSGFLESELDGLSDNSQPLF